VVRSKFAPSAGVFCLATSKWPKKRKAKQRRAQSIGKQNQDRRAKMRLDSSDTKKYQPAETIKFRVRPPNGAQMVTQSNGGKRRRGPVCMPIVQIQLSLF